MTITTNALDLIFVILAVTASLAYLIWMLMKNMRGKSKKNCGGCS